MKKIIGILCAMIIGLLPVKAEEYKYKVTFMAGLHGDKEGMITEMEVGIGETINLPDLPDGEGMYTAKGWHVSGKDEIIVGSYEVNEDTVFVASYGVSGDMIEYKVNYVDQQGNTIAESDTFHGKRTDKPVIAYKYIPNYEPVETKAFTVTLGNLTGPLTFVYRRVEAPQPQVQVVEEVVQQPAENNGTPAAPATPAQPANPTVNPDNNQGTNENTEAAPENNQQETIEENETPQTQPQEIIDLDDEQTPLSPPEEEDKPEEEEKPPVNEEESSTNTALWVGSIAGGSLLLLLLFLLLRRRRNTQE